MSFNSLITKLLEGSNIGKLKIQAKNPQIPESSFRLDQTLHLHINFNTR